MVDAVGWLYADLNMSNESPCNHDTERLPFFLVLPGTGEKHTRQCFGIRAGCTVNNTALELWTTKNEVVHGQQPHSLAGDVRLSVSSPWSSLHTQGGQGQGEKLRTTSAERDALGARKFLILNSNVEKRTVHRW